ncbi:hypothetical protein B0I35DRAFT_407684 [Stachybotrys elegans]|uniref:Uncharacterized protein n=1 Tax=Stachybotrys elegans TaxID=80388 RepID=A0A8K0SYN8_9HYPO|nr:hypothetical protein B0I35DRAFT_407684 [Stachybotrys elegans]
MSQITVHQSFDTAINPFAIRTQRAPKDASQSSNSTRDAEPPKMGHMVNVDFWLGYADPILHSHKSQLSAVKAPCFEPTRVLTAEADVDNAAALELINPVELALSARHAGGGIWSRNQVYNDNTKARADKAWMCHNRAGERSFFAVLEYKYVGDIRPQEFYAAWARPEDRRNHLIKLHEGRNTPGKQLAKHASLFKSNSNTLIRQAVHYANSYETQYIALFDWDTLVLLHLEDQEGPAGGDYCYMTVIQDKSLMRRALLGFLERAYQDAMGTRNLPVFPTINSGK